MFAGSFEPARFHYFGLKKVVAGFGFWTAGMGRKINQCALDLREQILRRFAYYPLAVEDLGIIQLIRKREGQVSSKKIEKATP